MASNRSENLLVSSLYLMKYLHVLFAQLAKHVKMKTKWMEN